MTLQGAVHQILLYIVCIGEFSVPEEMYKTCWEMKHRGTMDRGFTALLCSLCCLQVIDINMLLLS